MDFYDKWPELAGAEDVQPFEESHVLDRFAAFNNIRTLAGCKDWCVGVLVPNENSVNPYGKIHGGAMETLADTVCGHLMYLNKIAGVTVNAETHFLRDPRFGPIFCKASPVYGAGLVMTAGVKERMKIYVPAQSKPLAEELMQAFFPETENP